MRRRFLMSLALGLCLAGAVIWVGCSNDTITKVSPAGSDDDSGVGSGVTYYFPLHEDYQTIYDVGNGDGTHETVTYTVGKEVTRGNETAREWLSYTRSRGYDTGYFQATATCLNYFESPTSVAEKILQLPLTTGQSWTRTGGTNLETNTETDIVFDLDYKNNDNDTVAGGSGLAKNYPTTGASTMTVTGVESVQLSDGSFFSGVVKITNTYTANTYNIYWFAPGIGLVKWVIGAASISASTGTVVGELRSYGLK
jgi:hypothetical protein